MRAGRKQIIIIAAIAFLLIAGYGILNLVRDKPYSAKIDVEVAPSNSIVIINGKRSHEGVTKVKPGKIEVVARRDGFESISKTLAVLKDESVYVGIVLLPNAAGTKNWYNEHLPDLKKAEKISSKNFDVSSKKAASSLPLVLKLPYLGPGLAYRIDYGGQSQTPDAKPAIYIKAATEEGRLDALNWIKNQGVDPSSLQIVFINP